MVGVLGVGGLEVVWGGIVRGPSTSLRMTDFFGGRLTPRVRSGCWGGLRRPAVGGYLGRLHSGRCCGLRRWGHRRLPGSFFLRRFLLSRWLFCLEESVEGWVRGPSTSLRMTDFLEGGLRRALRSGCWGGLRRPAVGGYRLNCIPALLRLRRWGHRRLPGGRRLPGVTAFRRCCASVDGDIDGYLAVGGYLGRLHSGAAAPPSMGTSTATGEDF
jgi:hypothetical protein